MEFASGEKLQTIFKIAKAPPGSEITVRVLSLTLTDKTPDDFRLSAFGLPEPADATLPTKPTRWYLWLLVAAGVCAALAFGFASLRRRLARPTPRPI
jgi:hypothetical protein